MQVIKIFFLMCLLSACSPPPEHEVSRATSPDNILDVVITEVDTGATVPTPTRIYITPKGEKIDDDPIVRADHFQLKKIYWVKRNLIIEFYDGRIFSYTNFWRSEKVDNFKYEVRVFLDDTNKPE